MSGITCLDGTDPRFPARLREHPQPPAALWMTGALTLRRVFAVVGTRRPIPEAAAFAADFARALVSAGAVVASGGAIGIDAAVHRAALDAGGVTWVVAGTGLCHTYPPEHASLFDEVVRGGGALLSTFPPEAKATRTSFLQRNGILAALAEAVIVVQAGLPSGALSTAGWARRLTRPLYVVPVAPWAAKGFEGSAVMLRAGAEPLVSIDAFLRDFHLQPPDAQASGEPNRVVPSRELAEEELALLRVMGRAPLHTDEIAARCEAPPRTVAWALLTLALENVVVEGPTGFFRRI